jgi:hypothetical protein
MGDLLLFYPLHIDIKNLHLGGLQSFTYNMGEVLGFRSSPWCAVGGVSNVHGFFITR